MEENSDSHNKYSENDEIFIEPQNEFIWMKNEYH